MATKCGVEFHDGKAMCSVHTDTQLTEIGAVEVNIGAGPSPHQYEPTGYFCPVSGQGVAYIMGIPPLG